MAGNKDLVLKQTNSYLDLMLTKDAGGLMSISWTQKVKLFYAVLLANNSHCSGVM